MILKLTSLLSWILTIRCWHRISGIPQAPVQRPLLRLAVAPPVPTLPMAIPLIPLLVLPLPQTNKYRFPATRGADIPVRQLRRSAQRSLLSLLKLRLLPLMFQLPHLFVMVGIGALCVTVVSQQCLALCAT